MKLLAMVIKDWCSLSSMKFSTVLCSQFFKDGSRTRQFLRSKQQYYNVSLGFWDFVGKNNIPNLSIENPDDTTAAWNCGHFSTGGFIGDKAIVCGGYDFFAGGWDVYTDECYSITNDKIELFAKDTGYRSLPTVASSNVTQILTVPENECEAFAVLWSKTAVFRGAWQNVNMQPLPWAPTALIPHIRAFKRGI